jgi:tetratricopeptide (TPR) repeat protein/peptidoglycan/xylan/chitin deacetylase (PgdA/CDA1 family)
MVRRVAVIAALVLATAPPAAARSPGQAPLDAGVARYKAGDFHGALVEFQKAVDLDPALIKAWENLGWAQHRLGDDKEALRIWTTVLKLEPGNVDAWNAVGDVRLDAGSWREAAVAFERSLARKPEQPDARLRLGRAYEQLGRLDDAASQYRTILKRKPTDLKATVRLADLEEGRGRWGAAEAPLREALHRGKDDDGLIAKRLARVVAKRGDEAYHAENWGTAQEAYREAMRFDREKTVYGVNLGWALRKAGRNDDAVAAWRQVIDRGGPAPPELWQAIGDALRDAGRLAEAREAYGRAVRAAPQGTAALYALAAMAMESGDVPGASASLEAMFSRASVDPSEFVRCADLYIRYEALDAGERFFTARAGEPGRREAAGVALARLAAARGGAAYRAGDDKAASEFYQRALAADPGNRAALRDYGWTLWRQSDWAGVRRVWSGYAGSFPKMAEPHELLARLELQHGTPAAAMAEARLALALEPSDSKGPNILLTKAYLADGKYRTARSLAETLAGANPDDLAVQTLYGETLWRSLDFQASRVQWRKVIDMGSEIPRATHYWLRSMYETGDYGEAIDAAQRIVAAGHATEPVYRLLAEDAQVRMDDASTVRWYRDLVTRFPQRIAYWVTLAETYERMDRPRLAEDTLEQALLSHPDSPELRLRLAEVHLTRHRPGKALDEYRALKGELGRNRTVFMGEVHALTSLGRYDEALMRLRADADGFLEPHERALEEAAIFEDLGLRAEAAARRADVAKPSAVRVDLPILLYHGLAEHPRSMNMPLGNFVSQVSALAADGYTAITLTELDAMRSGKQPFPAKPILLTFDDARADSFQLGDPVLVRFGMKATMFVPTVRIAEESAFNADWPKLRELRATGRWDFQSHGHFAHDPIPVDAAGGIAEFLVNRQWLADQGRQETRDEYVARVDGDYAECRRRLVENLPGQSVLGYAFPFSEMGQLHGGNDASAFAVNQDAFDRYYRYGFVQDDSGYNVVGAGPPGPVILRRLNVPREWTGERLLAHLAGVEPQAQAAIDAARWDLWNARPRRAEATLRSMIAKNARTAPDAGLFLARALQDQDRMGEAKRVYAALPSGPEWVHLDPFHKKVGRDIAWETDPQSGLETRASSDSDGRDLVEARAAGQISFRAPFALFGSAGSVKLEDRAFPELKGAQATLGGSWFAPRGFAMTGWVRYRGLNDDVQTWNGELGFRGGVDRNRFGLTCGVVDQDTVGALRDGILKRGCDASYEFLTRTWRTRFRADVRDLTDGNAQYYAWADGTVGLGARRWVEVGGRLEVGDSRQDSTLYYAPQSLITLLALVRSAHAFASGASFDAEAGVGPSRDDVAGSRVVGRARVAWTQDWSPRWRTIVTGEYGQTPGYHRTALTASFGYRF